MKALYWLEDWWVHPFAPSGVATGRAYRAALRWPERTYAMPLPAGYLRAYRCVDRNADVVAREPYRTILAAAHWWMQHRWMIEEGLIRLGVLRSAVEGDWYKNFTLDPPGLWGTPLRKHEVYFDRRFPGGGTLYERDGGVLTGNQYV